MHNKIAELIKEYAVIVFASVLYAIAFVWFFDAKNISMGGLTGIAQIINYYIPALPIGMMTLVMNIPLFILGVKYRGIKILFNSLFAMVVSSVFIDTMPLIVNFPTIDDSLMSCIFGGALLGLSLGMMLWVGATTGGTELAASLLKRKFVHIQIGRICLIMDIVVILIYALVFKDIYNAMYAGIALFISSNAMDAVIYGRRRSKISCIICDEGEAITKALLEEDLGVTQLQGKGGFTKGDKTILICAFKPNKIARIKHIVSELDDKAFVIVCDTKDIFGEGFDEYDANAL